MQKQNTTMIPFEAIYQVVKGQSKIAVEKIKSFDYRSKKYLVKPTLAFLGVTALATSAAMYISGNQNISEEVPKKAENIIQPVQTKVQEKKIEEISMKFVTGTFNPVLPKNVLWYSTPAAKASKGSGH